MSCSINYDVLRAYPEIVPAIFVSSAQEGFNRTDSDKDAYITNNPLGYMTELEKVGQGSTAPATINNNVPGNNPYSTYLRPVTDLSEILKAQKVLVEKVEFYAYDTMKEDSAYQDSEAFVTMIDSRSANKSYPQSYSLNSPAPVFLPNFFRPQVRINNIDLIKGLQSSNYGTKRNQGDMSIGLPVPVCIDVYREFGRVTDIQTFAQMVQIIPNSSPQQWMAQRYAIQCIIYFRCGTGTVEFKN